eukprot:6470732-Prymnesium_polylepis.1
MAGRGREEGRGEHRALMPSGLCGTPGLSACGEGAVLWSGMLYPQVHDPAPRTRTYTPHIHTHQPVTH